MPSAMDEDLQILHEVEATYIPSSTPALFLWQAGRWKTESAIAAAPAAALPGAPASEILSIPARWKRSKSLDGLALARVDGVRLPLADGLTTLVELPLVGEHGRRASRSLAVWSAAAKLALELVAAHCVVPWASEKDGIVHARWRAALRPDDRRRAGALARALPMAGRAWAGASSTRGRPKVLAAGAAVRGFLDAAVDVLLRPNGSERTAAAWTARLAAGLGPGGDTVPTRSAVEGKLPEHLRHWVAPGLGEASEAPVRCSLRLELPGDGDGSRWPLVIMAEAAEDPSLQAEAEALWTGRGPAAAALLDLADDVQEALLLEIDRACRLWPALERCLDDPAPARLMLAAHEVVELLTEVAPLLGSVDIAVRVPPELSVEGRQRLRARVRGRSKSAAEGSGARVAFGLEQVLEVRWDAALGDQPLSLQELQELAQAKQPLVRWRDQWVLVDQRDLAEIVALVEQPTRVLQGAAALRAALTGEVEGRRGRQKLVLDSDDELLSLVAELREGAGRPVAAAPGLNGTLRPYQAVGAAWLEQLGRLGLGACLADDMGLGKTIQVIAYLLRRRAAVVTDRPSLIVCPTSVLGNWQRELGRFAPAMPTHLHHGPMRASSAKALEEAAGPRGVIITSYGLLRSDAELLGAINWDVAVLDEAQFIKNHRSKVAQAAFGLKARHRLALTGTPVENRLTDLWSIFAFTNAGLLGGITAFKKQVARPVERFRDPQALTRLQRLTSPFILRRTKSDPGIAPELPSRIVLRSDCSLTREQASLYQATLDAAMAEIESSDGIDRRGRVLGLITALKQICNHPAQFLRTPDASPERSGKLRRLGEELETVFAEGEAALVFTQYRTMGDLLTRFMEERFAFTPPFLHGGVSRSKREAMVARFQREDGPPAMVVSVKAGGTGLNLTRASHVVHFDRWWNPAVEEQATGRAHRIGQQRTVLVHTMVCAGTLEERIDRMLDDKAELARLAVTSGEQWLTDLDDGALRDLLQLGDHVVADEDVGEST